MHEDNQARLVDIIKTDWETEDVRHEVWSQRKETFGCGVIFDLG